MSEKTRTHLDIIESSICFVSAEMKEKEKRIKELEETLRKIAESPGYLGLESFQKTDIAKEALKKG